MNTVTKIKVTSLNRRWHARLFINGVLYSEMACDNRLDIGWICREQLRWADKLACGNQQTKSARHRQQTRPTGRVEDIVRPQAVMLA